MAAYETGRFADVSPGRVAAVRSPADLAAVVSRMREDLLDRGEHEWGNPKLEGFLEALAALAEDRRFNGQPTWADLADLLVSATGYE